MSETPVALVTGGGTGIGAACGRALAAEGLRVVVHYRGSREKALKLAGTVADAKRERRERLKAITTQSRAMRTAHVSDAKRQRDELRAAIAAARAVIKDKCARARGAADEATAARLIAAIGELDEVRERLRLHLAGIKLPPKDPGRVRGGQRAAELQSELTDSVAYDLETTAPELEPVWRNMARRMPARYRASADRSAFEAFLDWAGDHPASVAEIQDTLLGRSIKELESREEEEQREIYEQREATRLRAASKLAKLTPATARKLDAEAALDRFEAVTNALAVEPDAGQVAALRRASDILQNDLVSRGLFEPPAFDQASGDVPF